MSGFAPSVLPIRAFRPAPQTGLKREIIYFSVNFF